ncbi:hypothetical protein J6Y73_01515 [bacterium]|nr:hypothetical protein [bacterium]
MPDLHNLNYKSFLESLNYDESRIQKYFKKIIEDLEKEVVLLKDKKNEDIRLIYEHYESNLTLYDKVKEDILSKYFDEFQEINEDYNFSLARLENEYIRNREKLLDIIDQEKNIIQALKRDLLIVFYERKKDSQANIRDINKTIDSEYEKHTNIIMDAKEKLLSNNEFYINVDNHIKELNKTIYFLNKCDSLQKDLLKIEIDRDLNINDNVINSYLEIIDNEIDKVKETSLLIDNYQSIKDTIDKISRELSKRIDILSSDYFTIKDDIKERFETINHDISSVNSYFEINNIEDDNKKNAILDAINKKKDRIVVSSSISLDLLEKEKNNINEFKKALEKLNNSLYSSYSSTINTNTNTVLNLLSSLKLLLSDLLSTISLYKEDLNESINTLEFLNKRFSYLELKKREETLIRYRDFLINLLEENKEVDTLAFEILTNESILKIKLLELKRELLTLNDYLNIYTIEYDIGIKEIEETKKQTQIILDKRAELDLIEHDFKIDKSILKHELDNKIYLLDFRKEIDILRCDYMIAYTRLENIEKVIDIINKEDPKIIDMESRIALERIIELTLLDFSGKKNVFDSSHIDYEKHMEQLDNETNSRIRYLNNVLEIERNNFEEKTKKLKETTIELKKAVYPALINNKKIAGDKLKALKKENNKEKISIKNQNDIDKLNYKECLKSIDIVLDKYSSLFIDSYESILNDIDDFKNNIDKFIKNELSITKDMISELNSSLSSFDYKNIKKIKMNKELSMNYINKKVSLIIESSFDTKLTKYQNKINKYISNEIDNFKKESLNLLDKVKPYSDAQLKEILENKDRELKEKFASIVIENTIKSTPYLNELDEIDIAQDKVKEVYENDIANFKKQYLSSMDSIKKDYQERYNELTNFKETALRYNNEMNDAISKKIFESYRSVRDSYNLTINNLYESNKIQIDDANEMIEILSTDIQEKNIHFNNTNKEIDVDNANYRIELSNKAIEYYQEIQSIKLKNEKDLIDLINSKLAYRDEYIKNLRKDASSFKESYAKMRSSIISSNENKILDKVIEFTDKYNKIKDDSYKEFDEIEKPIHTFIENSESLSDNLINKAHENTSSYTENAIKSLDKFIDELDKELENII